MFNLTNVQTVTSRDEVFCTTAAGCNAHVDNSGKVIPSTDPAFASTPTRIAGPLTNARAQNPNFNRDIAWAAPRVFRLGARISF